MRKCLIFLLLAAALATGVCAAADVLQEEAAILGADKLEDALPAEAEEALMGSRRWNRAALRKDLSRFCPAR